MTQEKAMNNNANNNASVIIQSKKYKETQTVKRDFDCKHQHHTYSSITGKLFIGHTAE